MFRLGLFLNCAVKRQCFPLVDAGSAECRLKMFWKMSMLSANFSIVPKQSSACLSQQFTVAYLHCFYFSFKLFSYIDVLRDCCQIVHVGINEGENNLDAHS